MKKQTGRAALVRVTAAADEKGEHGHGKVEVLATKDVELYVNDEPAEPEARSSTSSRVGWTPSYDAAWRRTFGNN